MNIEPGDLFIVTRGIKLNTDPLPALWGGPVPGDEWKVKGENREPRYDRSHEGHVYRALQICGPSIAAEVIIGSPFSKISGWATVGSRMAINTDELRVWPVTRQYLEALQVSPPAEASAAPGIPHTSHPPSSVLG